MYIRVSIWKFYTYIQMEISMQLQVFSESFCNKFYKNYGRIISVLIEEKSSRVQSLENAEKSSFLLK